MCVDACCIGTRDCGGAVGICCPEAKSVAAWDGMGSDREGHKIKVASCDTGVQDSSDEGPLSGRMRGEDVKSVPKAAAAQRAPIDAPGYAMVVGDGVLERRAMERYERFYGLPRGS